MSSPRSPSARRRSRASKHGLGLIEAMLALAVLAVGLVTLATTAKVGSDNLHATQETALATAAARNVLEGMADSGIPFRLLLAAYVPDTAIEIPDGLTLPTLSSRFAVEGLSPTAGATDGMIGEISFPLAAGAGGSELRENLCNLDLDGDETIDALDHATDYRILPVRVTLRWLGAGGERTLELQTVLAGH